MIRYNISENDAPERQLRAIHLWSSGSSGEIQDAEIYNNTVYLTPSAKGTPKAQSGGMSNIKIRNNIFQTTSGQELVLVDRLTDLKFEGNYWTTGAPSG